MSDLGITRLPIALPATATRARFLAGLRRCPWCRRWIRVRVRGDRAGLLHPHGPRPRPCAGTGGLPLPEFTTVRPAGGLL